MQQAGAELCQAQGKLRLVMAYEFNFVTLEGSFCRFGLLGLVGLVW